MAAPSFAVFTDVTAMSRAFRAMEDFQRSMAKAADAMRASSTATQQALLRLGYALERGRADGRWKVRMAGWEARMYVRGGHGQEGPFYPAVIARGQTGDRDLVGLRPAERARLAVAYLEGFIGHNEPPTVGGAR